MWLKNVLPGENSINRLLKFINTPRTKYNQSESTNTEFSYFGWTSCSIFLNCDRKFIKINVSEFRRNIRYDLKRILQRPGGETSNLVHADILFIFHLYLKPRFLSCRTGRIYIRRVPTRA